MIRDYPATTLQRQRGAALLLMMLAVLVAATAMLVSSLNSNAFQARRASATQDVLSRARNAVIDYASVFSELNPGMPLQLPCPDLDDTGSTIEGEAHTGNCGGRYQTVIGRLPWRTLGIDALRDSSYSCLWYVVSGSHKGAAANTAELINPDTHGQLLLYDLQTGAVVDGQSPELRPVALIFAPLEPLSGQSRTTLPGGNTQCKPGFVASDFLESDAGTGVSNNSVSGAADSIEEFVVAQGPSIVVNDRVAVIGRADIEAALSRRPDYVTQMRALSTLVGQCVARYGKHNSAGVDDRRLPWAAAFQLADYRPDAAYNDVASALSGRLPDDVDDSGAATGNGIARVISDCDPAEVPGWNAHYLALWQHWKDHFFYVVADSHAPSAGAAPTCGNCFAVNGAGQYAAVILFAGARLAGLGQTRNAPPIDTDTKQSPVNYLEGANSIAIAYAGGSADFESGAAQATFNDVLTCIDGNLAVSEC